MFALILLMTILGIPAAAYVAFGGGRSAVWGLITDGVERRGASVYRGASSPRWKEGSAPWVVRVAALSSFFLGQMVVPGALAMIVGFIFFLGMIADGNADPILSVSVLSAPTGLIVAGKLLKAGASMLRRDADSATTARIAASWALWHNGVLIAAMGAASIAATASPKSEQSLPYALFCVVYACISIGQALTVRSAASAIERYNAGQSEAPAPPISDLPFPAASSY